MYLCDALTVHTSMETRGAHVEIADSIKVYDAEAMGFVGIHILLSPPIRVCHRAG